MMKRTRDGGRCSNLQTEDNLPQTRNNQEGGPTSGANGPPQKLNERGCEVQPC